jgi:hypothetical protein
MHSRPSHSLSRVEILDRVVLLAEKAGRDPYDVAREYRSGVETDDTHISEAYSLLALLPDDHAVFRPLPAPGARHTKRIGHRGK